MHLPLICIIAPLWPPIYWLAKFSAQWAFLIHESSFVFLMFLHVAKISIVFTFHLHQRNLYMPLAGNNNYCICLLLASKIFCTHYRWPRSLLSMPFMCIIALFFHDLYFTCLVYVSKLFVCLICLQSAKFSIEYGFYMRHSSFLPLICLQLAAISILFVLYMHQSSFCPIDPFSRRHSLLNMPFICIIALLSNLYAFSCSRSPLYLPCICVKAYLYLLYGFSLSRFPLQMPCIFINFLMYPL